MAIVTGPARPCPFCGHAESHVIEHMIDGPLFAVMCRDCGAMGSAGTDHDDAVERWNRRTGEH